MSGLIANMLVGAGLGGIEGEGEEQAKRQETNLKAYNEQTHERLKQQLESERTARDIGLTGAQTRQTDAAKPRTIAPGATERVPGQPDFQAPDTRHPKELLDYYAAHGREADARAAALKAAGEMKDLPASVKVYVDSIGKSLQALDKEEASGMLQPDGLAALNKRRSLLTQQMLGALTSGSVPSGDAATPTPIVNPFAPTGAAASPQNSTEPEARASGPTSSATPKPGIISRLSNVFNTSGALPVEQYLSRRRGGFVFNAPTKGGLAQQLNGRTFTTPQEAQQALDALSQ